MLHVAYLTCKCIVKINAYLKYLLLHFPLERMAHTHYKNHPVEIKLYIHLQSSELAVRVHFNETNIFYSYATVFLVIKKKLLRCHEGNLRENIGSFSSLWVLVKWHLKNTKLCTFGLYSQSTL